MNDRLCFIVTLLAELGEQLTVSTVRDIKYIKSRFKHEGMSFLTITLPAFSDGLERGIENGVITPNLFQAFAWSKRGCSPKFLSGFIDNVFDKGVLKSDACPDSIFAIRQISRYLKKALIECSSERLKKAELKYIATDEELSLYESDDNVKKEIDNYLDGVISIFGQRINAAFKSSDLVCSHGPGATAERLTRNSRISIEWWPIRAEPFFPKSRHTLPNLGWLSMENYHSDDSSVLHLNSQELGVEQFRKTRFISPEQEPPVRVVFVPKTLKTPRVIAIEPSPMQFMQQALMKWMTQFFERDALFKRSLHFTDQTINRESARIGSIDRQSMTMDLSEASDRVSLSLVKKLLAYSPGFLGSILACRSSSAETPSGKLIILNKFASMGSATCFPVEAFTFYCLIQAAAHKFLGVHPTESSIMKISDDVHVYGDDLIFPVEWAQSITEMLLSHGLKINDDKSFSRSHFRESCGGDYYKGYDVKPSYFRVDPSRLSERLTASELVSLCEHSNQLYDKGLWKTCQAIRTFVERKLRREVPIRSYASSGLYFKSFRASSYNRWSVKYCKPISKAYITKQIVIRDLNRCPKAIVTSALRNISREIPLNLCESVRPRSLCLKTGWLS